MSTHNCSSPSSLLNPTAAAVTKHDMRLPLFYTAFGRLIMVDAARLPAQHPTGWAFVGSARFLPLPLTRNPPKAKNEQKARVGRTSWCACSHVFLCPSRESLAEGVKGQPNNRVVVTLYALNQCACAALDPICPRLVRPVSCGPTRREAAEG